MEPRQDVSVVESRVFLYLDSPTSLTDGTERSEGKRNRRNVASPVQWFAMRYPFTRKHSLAGLLFLWFPHCFGGFAARKIYYTCNCRHVRTKQCQHYHLRKKKGRFIERWRETDSCILIQATRTHAHRYAPALSPTGSFSKISLLINGYIQKADNPILFHKGKVRSGCR